MPGSQGLQSGAIPREKQKALPGQSLSLSDMEKISL